MPTIFVLKAALEKAIMVRKRTLQLSQQDSITIMNALAQPAKPNAKLQQAASRYLDKTH